MSFRLNKNIIEEGDTVILYFGFENLYQIRIEKDKVHQFKYGALKHNDLIGKQFGVKVHCPKGWLYALYPTPELWTVSLPHRTQILYSRDISEVTFQLDLKPGSVVVESGINSQVSSSPFFCLLHPLSLVTSLGSDNRAIIAMFYCILKHEIIIFCG